MFSTQVTLKGLLCLNNMTDDNVSSPENSSDPVVESVSSVRRISNPRPKKAAKVHPSDNSAVMGKPEKHDIQPQPEHDVAPLETSHAGGDWPEPEAESTGSNQSQTESAKRKRRRRKGKGGVTGLQNSNTPSPDESVPSDPIATESPQESRPRPHPAPQPAQRSKIDPALLTKMAWKIYLAEVSEEGVALIGDNDAKDLSRRCFRLAEIFIEEQSRRR